jgi:hypothetical protein
VNAKFTRPALLMAAAALIIPAAVVAQTLLYEAFNGTGVVLDTGKWSKVDSENKLKLSNGWLQVGGGKAVPAWGDPALYSTATFTRTPGQTLITNLRPSFDSGNGLVMHFAASAFPTTPLTTGYGVAIKNTAASNPLPRFSAVTPGKTIDYWNKGVAGSDPKTANSIDYTTITILRSTGSWHLVSGGKFGQFPQATLIWVNDAGTDNNLYAGISNNNATGWIDSLSVSKFSGSFATEYGLATAADSFNRSGDLNTTTTDRAGTLTWNVASGAYSTDGSKVASSVASTATITAHNQGSVSVKFTSPSSGEFSGGLIFRYQDADNYWYVLAEEDRYVLGNVVASVNTVVATDNTSPLAAAATAQLTLVIHDNSICAYADNNLLFSNCYDNSTLVAATKVGITNSAATVSFDDFALWPRYVNLPTDVPLRPGTVPTTALTTLVQDTFTDSNSVSLGGHSMNTGAGWQIVTGGWEINNNQTVPTAESAVAVTDAGSADVAVSANITFPQASLGTTEWLAGLVVRYTNSNTYTWLRVKWQNGDPILEIWDTQNGIANNVVTSAPGLINASNITNLLATDQTHLLSLITKGNQIAAYLDGQLLVQGTTSNLTGTKVGLINGASISTPYITVDNFTVQAVQTDVIAPPAVTTLTGPTTPTKTAPTLTWQPVNDDIGNVAYYRVYRSSTNGQLGTKINNDGATTATTYTDNSLTVTGVYYYTVRAVDTAGNESVSSSNKQVSVSFDLTVPTGSILINEGQTITNKLQVLLELTAVDTISAINSLKIQVSNTNSFGATWSNYAADMSWNLTEGVGTKTVYYRVQDQAGNISTVYSDTIAYDPNWNGAPDSSTSSTSSTISSTSSATSTFTNDNLGTYTAEIRLVNGGQPVKGSVVSLQPRNLAASTDSNGFVRFTNLAPGNYTLQFNGSDQTYTYAFSLPNADITNDIYRAVWKLSPDYTAVLLVVLGGALIGLAAIGGIFYTISQRRQHELLARKHATRAWPVEP